MDCAQPKSENRLGSFLAVGQILIVLSAVGALLLAPPANGQIALYPITSAGHTELTKIATNGGRKLLARTRVGDGFVIQGSRPSFGDLLLNHGILALAVPDSGCSGDRN